VSGDKWTIVPKAGPGGAPPAAAAGAGAPQPTTPAAADEGAGVGVKGGGSAADTAEEGELADMSAAANRRSDDGRHEGGLPASRAPGRQVVVGATSSGAGGAEAPCSQQRRQSVGGSSGASGLPPTGAASPSGLGVSRKRAAAEFGDEEPSKRAAR